MSYGRLGPRIEDLQDEVATMLPEVEATDLAVDAAHGLTNEVMRSQRSFVVVRLASQRCVQLRRLLRKKLRIRPRL